MSNDENGRTVSSLGLIPLIITALNKYHTLMDVSKSGCHALAILTDVKGQASKMSYAGGVSCILNLIAVHSTYADLHRVAFVVLLRMLQESVHVSRDIVQFDGVRILLESLNAGGAQDDTVAAVTHILQTVTNRTPSLMASIETQLWASPPALATTDEDSSRIVVTKAASKASKSPGGGGRQQSSTLLSLVGILSRYTARKDVIRSSTRVILSVVGYAGIAVALNLACILDALLVCLSNHEEMKEIPECFLAILRQLLTKKISPNITFTPASNLASFSSILKHKLLNEDCIEVLTELCSQLFAFAEKEEIGTEVFQILRSRCIKVREADNFKRPLHYYTNLLRLLEVISMSSERIGTEILTEPSIVDAILQLTSLPEEASRQEFRIKMNHFLQKLNSKYRGRLPQKDIIFPAASESSHDDEGSSLLFLSQSLPRGTINVIREGAHYHNQPIRATNSKSLILPELTLTSLASTVPKNDLQLLETWPSWPEPLLLSTSVAALAMGRCSSTTTSAGTSFTVYESTSAGGQGTLSRSETSDNSSIAVLVDEDHPQHSVEAPIQAPCNPFPTSLTFDADFESGNLLRAVQRENTEFDLTLRNDVHTTGHTQWFYFTVSNTHSAPLAKLAAQGMPVPAVKIKFNIINLTKSDSLFNSGMQVYTVCKNTILFTRFAYTISTCLQPVLYSHSDAASEGVGWLRAGSNIFYFANQVKREGAAGEGDDYYYTLTFTIEFKNANDTYRIAYTYPYTYQDYKLHMASLVRSPLIKFVLRRDLLCKTLGGQDCDIISITNFKNADRLGPITMSEMKSFKGTEKKQLKPCIFFSARVHPGETQASWMMKGMLDFLSSDAPSAVLLRDLFVIFLIPMLNIDGVMHGNHYY